MATSCCVVEAGMEPDPLTLRRKSYRSYSTLTFFFKFIYYYLVLILIQINYIVQI
jgi:hypothetical protein